MRLIFLYSLPRSGSTLLQRVLSAHPEICTVSEPWILLPFCYAHKTSGSYTEYHQQICSQAIMDFIEKMPNKEEDYYTEIGKFAHALYKKQDCGTSKYFLDKTPRYYLIIDLIDKIFPDAKYIFLFRNPIQIMASMIESWGKGRLRIEDNYIDLYMGPDRLADGYNKFKKKSIAVYFDELLQKPKESLQRIFDYLEVENIPSVIDHFKEAKLDGKMGDKSGYNQYDHLEPVVQEKWKKTFNSKLRKKIIKKYISKISPYTLKTFGFSKSQMIKEIDSVNPEEGGYFIDHFHLLVGRIKRYLEIPLIRDKIQRRKDGSGPFVIHR